MVGTGSFVEWSKAASVIAPIRADARAKLAKSGAKLGKEILSFTNETAEGGDVFVGFEVTDATGSLSLPGGFSIREVSNADYFVRGDHGTSPDTAAWITFVTRVQREGFELFQPGSMYQVYSGADTEPVSMYIAVAGPKK